LRLSGVGVDDFEFIIAGGGRGLVDCGDVTRMHLPQINAYFLTSFAGEAGLDIVLAPFLMVDPSLHGLFIG